MQILFDALVVKSEAYRLIDAGIKTHNDLNYKTDYELRKLLLNVLEVKIARPIENGQYTQFSLDGEYYYTLNISFSDYLNIVPYHKANILLQSYKN